MNIEFNRGLFKEFRTKNLKLNQLEAAAMLGITRQTLAKIESGTYTPSLAKINDFAQKYGCSPSFLIKGA